jgi:hypothetical protein
MGVYKVCSNKSPWFKIDLGPGAYIQVSDFRAIMALFLILNCSILFIHYRIWSIYR